MKNSIKLFFYTVLIFLAWGCSNVKNENNQFYNGYTLVWADEFNNAGKPDTSVWGYELGLIRNHEAQFYTKDTGNIRIENGNLVIETRIEKVANPQYGIVDPDKPWLKWVAEVDTAKYTSGSIYTKGEATWKYGIIEVRAKLPEGVGLWPAIWMLGENCNEAGWPLCGEIDIMEHVGFEKDSIFGTVHTDAFNHTKGTQKGRKVYVQNPYTEYHLYSIKWTKDYIEFYLDNKSYFRFDNVKKSVKEWPFDQKFNLKLNIAVGGMLGGRKGIDDTVFPQKMLIDYVRIYQKN